MKSIDPFLNRLPSKTYNCYDFVREVWKHLTGEDIAEKLNKLVGAFANRKVTISGVKGFTELATPETPCFVVMQRFKFVPHIGIFRDGRVLHLHDRGVEFQPLYVAKRYFHTVRFYR